MSRHCSSRRLLNGAKQSVHIMEKGSANLSWGPVCHRCRQRCRWRCGALPRHCGRCHLNLKGIHPLRKGAPCIDLYIATRTDAPHLLKIGKSSNSHSRCIQLQRGHCFRNRFLAIFHRRGNCEKNVHRALAGYRMTNSEWLAINILLAVETIQDSQPAPCHIKHYELEEFARKNRQAGRTFKSTRCPHLSTA